MALKPEYLQGLPDELAALTENLEAQLIGDIARRIAKAGEITDTAAYQIMRLKEMGASTEYIEKLLADYLKTSDKAIERMIFDAAQTDSEFYQTVYARAGRPYVPFEYNEYLQQLAEAAVNQTKGELKNLTQSMGFAVRGANGQLTFLPAAKAYQSAMDKAHMLVASGGMDYITAVRMSVNDITASGLRFVDYASGVRNHADVAARRAVLTGVSQMTGKISERNAAELGTDVVEVTAHAGARPDHAVWQGKWFSLKGKDKRYPKLSTATGYGTVTGLKGANCRHDFYPVIPGIDQPAYTKKQLANIDPPPVTIGGKTYTYYEAEQRQREMERAIRKTKREIIAAEASGDNDQFTAKSVLLRRQREQYSEFSKAAGLLTRNERTQVAEFGRSAGSKSSWAVRKAKAAKSGGSGGTGGHAVTVNVPANPIQQHINQAPVTKPTFKNAKSIEEAQAYARLLGVEHPDYAKFTLERANNMNMALSTLPDDSMPYVVTDLQKYTAVTGAPLGKAQKNGYACTVTPYEIDLKRAGVADIPRTVGSGNTIVAVNTRNYKTIDSITESKAKSEEIVISRNLGKSYHFNTDGKATDFHECGHIYVTKHNIPVGFSADADRWYKETGCMMLKTTSEAWSEAYAAYYTHADDLPSYIRRYFDAGEWKDGSGSKVLTLDEWYKKIIDKSRESGINRP